MPGGTSGKSGSANKQLNNINTRLGNMEDRIDRTMTKVEKLDGQTINFKVKVDVADAEKNIELLNKRVGNLDGLAEYYRSAQNAEAKLISEWNNFIDKNLDKGMSELAQFGDDQAEEVYHLGAAYKALGGNLESISSEIKTFVDTMDSLRGDNIFNSDNFKTAFDGLKRFKDLYIEEIKGLQEMPFIRPDQVKMIGGGSIDLSGMKSSIKNDADEVDDTLTGISNSARNTADQVTDAYDQIGNAAKNAADQVEESARRQEQALARIAKAREEAKKNKKEYFDDYDYNYDSERQGYKINTDKTGKSLVEDLGVDLREAVRQYTEAQEDLQAAETDFINSFKENQPNADELFGAYEDALGKFNQLESEMEYLQTRFNEVSEEVFQNFTSEEWDADTIQWMIEAVKQLASAIEKLGKTFDAVDDKSPFSNLLSNIQSLKEGLDGLKNDKGAFGALFDQFDGVKSAITNAFDPKMFDGFKDALAGLVEQMSQLSGMTINPVTNITLNAGEDRSLIDAWSNKYREYLKLYERVSKAFNNAGKDQGAMFNFINPSIRRMDKVQYPDAASKFNLDVIQSSVNGTIEGYRQAIETLARYFKYLEDAIKNTETPKDIWQGTTKSKDDKTLNAQLAKLMFEEDGGHRRSTDIGVIERQIVTEAEKGTTKAAEYYKKQQEATKSLFGDTKKLEDMLENQVIPALEKMNRLLAQGFKIEDKEEVQTFFQKLAENVKTLEAGMSSITDTVGALNTVLTATDDNPNPLGLSPDKLQPLQQALDKVKKSLSDISQLMADSKLSSERLANMADAESKPEKKKRAANVVKNVTKSNKKGQQNQTVLEDEAVNQAAQDMEAQMDQVGKDSQTGFRGGFGSEAQKTNDVVRDFFLGIVDIAKDATGSHSPSVKFEDIGRDCVDGFVIGLNSGKDVAQATIRDVFDLNEYIRQVKGDTSKESEFANQFIDSIMNQFKLQDADSTKVSAAVKEYINKVQNDASLDNSFYTLADNLGENIRTAISNQMQGIETSEIDNFINKIKTFTQKLSDNPFMIPQMSDDQKGTIIAYMDQMISRLHEYQILLDGTDNTKLIAGITSNLEYLSNAKSNLEQYGTLNTPAGSQPRAVKDQEVKVKIDEQSLLDAKGRMQDVLGEIEVKVNPSGQLQESSQATAGVVKNQFDEAFKIIYNQIALLKQTLSDPNLSGLTITLNSNIGQQIQIIEEAVKGISKRLSTTAGTVVGDAVAQKADDITVTPDQKKPQETGVPIKIITDKQNLIDAKAKIEQAFSNILITITGLSDAGQQNLQGIIEKIQGIQTEVSNAVSGIISDFNGKPEAERTIYLQTNFDELYANIQTKLAEIKTFTSTIKFEVDNKKNLTTVIQDVKGVSNTIDQVIETTADKYKSLLALFRQNGNKEEFAKSLAENFSHDQLTEIAQMEKVTIPKKSSYKLDVRAERLASAIQERDAALQVPDKATEQYSKILTEINAVRTAIADLIKLLGTAPEKSVLSEEIKALQELLAKDIPAVEGLLNQQSTKIDASVNASIDKLNSLVTKINSVSSDISTKIEKPIGVNVEVYGPSKDNIAQVTRDIEQLKQLLNGEASQFRVVNPENLIGIDENALQAKINRIVDLNEELQQKIGDASDEYDSLNDDGRATKITAPSRWMSEAYSENDQAAFKELIQLTNDLSDAELKALGLSEDQISSFRTAIEVSTEAIKKQLEAIDALDKKKGNGNDYYLAQRSALDEKLGTSSDLLGETINNAFTTSSSNLTQDFNELASALSGMVRSLTTIRGSLEQGLDLSKITQDFQGLKKATYGISGNISSIADKLSKVPQIDLSNLVTQYTNLNVVTRGIGEAVEKVNSAIRILGTNKVLSEKIGELQSYLTTELSGLQSLVQTIQTYGTTNLTVVSADSGDLQNYVGYLTEISKVLQQLPFDMEQVNAAFEVLQDVIRGVLKTASESVLGIAGATATLVQDINTHDITIGVDSKPIVDEITRIQGLAQQILSHFTSTIEVKSNIDTEVDYINNRLKPLTDSTIEVELEVKSDIDTEVERINTRAAEVAKKESFIKVDTDVDTVVDHIKERAKEVESMQVGLAPIDAKTVETIVGQIGQVNSALEQLIPSPTFITAGEQIDALRQKFMDLVDVFRSNKDKDAFVTALQGFKKIELEQIAKYDGINVNASHSKGNTKDVIAGNIGDKVEEGLKRKSLADEPMQAAVKYEELFQKVKAVNEQVTTLRGQLDTLFSKQAFLDEGKLFTNLLDVLSKEIPKAILAKNNKFREEVTVVKGVVTDEVNELNRLKKAIEDVVSVIDFKNLNMNELKNVSAVFQTLEKLINSSSLKDFYDTMGKLAQTISAFNLDANNNNVFSRIEGMLSKTQELENLVKILAETEQRIKAAELALNGQNNNRNNNNGNQTPPGGGQHQWSPNSHQRWTIPNDAVLDDVFSNVEDNIRDRVRKDVEDAIGRVVKVITSTNVKGDLSSAILVGTKGTTRGGWKTDPKTQQKSFEFGGVTSKPFDEAYERKIDRQMDALDEYEKKLKDAGLWTKEFNDQLDGLWLKLDEADDSGEFFDGFKDLFDKFKTKVDTAIKDADKSTSDSIKTINKLAEARSNYNETVAKNIKDPLVTTQKDVQKAADVVKEAYEDAKQAMQGLIDDKNNQKVSKEQYIAGLRAFNSDDALYGSQESRNEIRNAKTSNVVKDIKAMADAYSKLNTQEAQDISKGGSASIFDRKTESTKEYTKALDKAKSSLKELLQTEKGIDADGIFNLLYADDANDPQKYGQVHQMYKDLIAMGDSIDDKKLDEFFDKLQKVSKADAFAGSSSSREGIGKSLASQYNIAEKALDKLAKALDKVQKYQEKLANGENVAGRLTGATNNLRDAQKDAAKIFATVGKYNQRYQIPGYKELEDKYNNTDQTAQDILNGGMSYNLNDGFKDASKGYETLAKGATNYYKILKKIANEELLSSNELRFMETVKDYYDKATKSAEEFERQLGVKSDDEFQIQLNSNRNKFLASMPEARKKVVDSVAEDLESQITKLNQKPATGQFGIDFRALSQDYEDLVAQISKIDWNGTSEQDFKDLIVQLEEIQKRVSELNTGEQYQPVNDVERQTVIRKASEWQAMHTGATEANAKLEELKEKLKAIDDQGSLNNLKAELEAIKTEAYEAGEAGMSFGDKLRTSFSNLTRYLMSFASFYRVIGALKQGVEIVHQLDSALKDVKMVVSDSTKSLQEWQLTTFDSADAVGGTAIDLQKSVASWVRLGKTFEEANEAAQASIKLMNVSEFTSIEDSTGALLSMTQAFDNLGFQQIIDQLNGVGDSFSSTTAQLADGMKNVAQVLQVSGNSFEQSLALLAAGNNSVQDMSKASMGIRTIALRLAGFLKSQKIQ